MKYIKRLIQGNKYIILAINLGVALGYFRWFYWGVSPYLSECYTNCIYEGLVGGLVVSLAQNKD